MPLLLIFASCFLVLKAKDVRLSVTIDNDMKMTRGPFIGLYRRAANGSRTAISSHKGVRTLYFPSFLT